MSDLICDVLVIGGGPGGYVCAIRAGQLGLKTVIADAGQFGGTCLNVGCIPSKALIHAAEEYDKIHGFAAESPLGISVSAPAIDLAKTMAWKDGIVSRLTQGVGGLLKKAKVTVLDGWATMEDGKTAKVETAEGVRTVHARHVVLATGSRSVELPGLPFDGPVLSSTGALALREVPGRLAVVGAGYIGLELGMAFAKLGARVQVVEATLDILPQFDKDLKKPVATSLARHGIEVLVNTRAIGVSGTHLHVETPDGPKDLEADKILVTVGRAPLTDGWGLEGLDLERDGRFVRIDDRCRTSMTGVFAIGDLTGEPMLAHRAMAQGEMVAELIAGQSRRFDARAIPAVCFTDPEIVSVGLAPSAAAGIDTVVEQFPFRANGRAMTTEDESGFVQVVARKDNHLVLGLHAVGYQVSELSAAFGLALEMGARLEDIAGTIHAHPTRGEAFQEAALKGLGHALHI